MHSCDLLPVIEKGKAKGILSYPAQQSHLAMDSSLTDSHRVCCTFEGPTRECSVNIKTLCCVSADVSFSLTMAAYLLDLSEVMTFRLSTTSGTTSCSRPLYSPSVFSLQLRPLALGMLVHGMVCQALAAYRLLPKVQGCISFFWYAICLWPITLE